MNSSVLAIVSACLSALILAPLVARVCRWLGVVDKPDGHRKLHSFAVPLTGGPTVFLSIVLAIVFTGYAFPGVLSANEGDIRFLVSLAVASLVIVVVGILDVRIAWSAKTGRSVSGRPHHGSVWNSDPADRAFWLPN